jgi:hypothetical protein
MTGTCGVAKPTLGICRVWIINCTLPWYQGIAHGWSATLKSNPITPLVSWNHNCLPHGHVQGHRPHNFDPLHRTGTWYSVAAETALNVIDGAVEFSY